MCLVRVQRVISAGRSSNRNIYDRIIQPGRLRKRTNTLHVHGDLILCSSQDDVLRDQHLATASNAEVGKIIAVAATRSRIRDDGDVLQCHVSVSRVRPGRLKASLEIAVRHKISGCCEGFYGSYGGSGDSI